MNEVITSNMGIWEILFVALIIFLVFGPLKISSLFGAFKEGANEFKKAVKSDDKKSKNKDEDKKD